MPTAKAREALYDQLTEVLGNGPAETMMSYLPDDKPATSAELKSEITGLRTELKAEIAELRSEVKGEIAELRSEVKADIADLRQEMREELREFRTDLRHLNDTLHAQTRVHVAASLGSAVTVAGLVFIAAQIV